MDLREYMRGVPEFDRFLTVDELHAGIARLAEDYPEIARLRRVGTSRLGEPLHLLSIGHGPKHAFIFGCPHPNEPIGAMMVHHLTAVLCRDAALRDGLGYTWHFIPCVDPDGTRLNEGWFAGPFTPRHYARHFFRPAPDQQVEWTFPVAYKRLFFDRVLPETQMLMRVIDELQPELMVSLHNAGFGGVYYYISRAAEPLYDTLHQLPAWEELPLNLGEPEAPFMQALAPAIYRMASVRESYDYLEAHGGDPTRRPSGTSSDDYARKYGTFTLVVEMPYFDDPRVNDQTVTDTRRRDAILHGLAIQEEATDILRRHFLPVERELRGHSPFERSVRSIVEDGTDMLEAQRRWARESPETDRPATVAELFSNNELVQFYRMLGIGMLVRMLEGEVAIGNGTPAIREHLVGARADFDRWCDRLESTLHYRAIPIRQLVAVQLGAVLATAQYLSDARG
ncbi:MAG: M14 family zinc carboxypeptidase [Sphaerobacter sp.]|nr:M14 family zinc carboxypeptidase [Sphaerobacter sp.]